MPSYRKKQQPPELPFGNCNRHCKGWAPDIGLALLWLRVLRRLSCAAACEGVGRGQGGHAGGPASRAPAAPSPAPRRAPVPVPLPKQVRSVARECVAYVCHRVVSVPIS